MQARQLLWAFPIVVCFVCHGNPVFAEADMPKLCAGYPVHITSELGALPQRENLQNVDVNSDGASDVIVAYREGGGGLYLNCGDGSYYRIVHSMAKLQVKPKENTDWAPIFIEWETDRSTFIDGRLYRPTLLPFDSNAPVDFLIEHDGFAYAMPFKHCESLEILSPRYRLDRKAQMPSNNERVTTIQLDLAQASFQINADEQEEYSQIGVQFDDINADDKVDVVLLYQERFGSGREAFGGLLLNCGDDSYVLSGLVQFGRAGVGSTALETRKISACGEVFTALAVKQPKESRNSHAKQAKAKNYNLYFYRPTLKDFISFSLNSRPDTADFQAEMKPHCAVIKHN